MKSIVCVALAMAIFGTKAALAADCCENCGCQCQCQKVCRVICETKKVPKVTYSCECEDFCVPGPSERTRVCDCDNCKKWVYTPTCGTVRTRKKLVKHEEMKEVVSYRWVVENMCPACATKTSDPNIAPEPEDAAARRSPNAALPVSYQTSGHEAIPFQPIPYPAIPNPPVSPTR